MDVAPNQTLYVSNLQQKIKKDELKKLLYALFGQFGRIVDIVAMRADNLRGQAWIVFADIAAATNALRNMQDFPFFERPLRVSFAKTQSHAVATQKGSKAAKKGKPPKAPAAAGAADGKAAVAAKKQPADGAAAAKQPGEALDVGEPNNKLFVENLPAATTSAMLEMLFQQFPGCKEVTTVPAKPGIAFIEFDTEMQATVAMAGLQGFKVTPQNAMKITYSK